MKTSIRIFALGAVAAMAVEAFERYKWEGFDQSIIADHHEISKDELI